MQGKDWDTFLIPYEQAVEELKVKFRSIRHECQRRNEYSPIEFVTGRIKKISSTLEKMQRLSVPMSELESGIEDIAGIRIMCQFEDDIDAVVELIRLRDGKDMKIVYVKNYIENTKDSGYRSYHVIVKYPVQTVKGEVEILAEIQIRTLAMNFWATIEHSLNYKYKENIPKHIHDRLKKAAEAAYQLDQEMSQIRNEIQEAQQLFEKKSSIVSKILRYIRILYLSSKRTEAEYYEARFEELWQTGELTELERLAQEIRMAARD